MSKTAVIVALLVALGLGLAAILLSQRNGKPAADAGPLLVFEPSSATEIRMDFPDGSSQAVLRGDEGWRFVLKAPGVPDRSWPASQTQVHAALRIFSTLMPGQAADGTIDKPAGTLTIKSGTAARSLKISPQRLAGRVLVEAAGRSAWVDANIAEMLITTGIQAWRDPAAFPGLGDSPSVISITGHEGGSLTLARTQGKWGLRTPIQEPADPDAAARLLAILSAVRIVDFCDKGPPSQTGLDKPVATLEIESSARADTGPKVGRWVLKVGTTADVAGRTVVAELTPGNGTPLIVIVAGEHLAAISADPMQYVSKQALRVEPADIGTMSITVPQGQGPCTRIEFRRSLEDWQSRCGDGDWTPALKTDVQALEAIVQLCTATVPERIESRAKREVPNTAATIEVGTAGGTPLGKFAIAMSDSKLSIVTESVVRDYPAAAATVIVEWLARR